ncbi:hypothetical protein Ciccas_009061 [Cichlidogyrus casuarinus]|uniref:ENTH domain-containing protein n=1 Tax=Cichlidogyrus casuarinus TaxID=1844966 RepID=A0ABD2PY52_9PLAT
MANMNISTKAAGKMVKQLAGSGTGQSLMDRVVQAKYSLAGSGLGKAVAKATTVELTAPKRKHLDYLINCSSEPNVSIPLLASLLVERIQETSWAAVFKTLITTHNLMNFGNEKFSQYLASNSCTMYLPNFNDKTSAISYEMSLFIRKYSKYVEEKTTSYRAMAFDFCKLLKALPVLEKQINVLLEFEAVTKDINNPIITAAFVLLYKDLIRLFASFNEGMINLIEKYFTLKRKECKVGMKLYHHFPKIMDKVTEFLTVAENLGIGERDSLGLMPVPDKVINAMEKHLALLEKKKKKDEEDEDDDEEESKKSKQKKHTTKVKMTVKMPSSPAKSKRPETPPQEEETDIFKRPQKAPEPKKSPEKTPEEEPSSSKNDKTDSKPIVTIGPADPESSSDEEVVGLPDDIQKEIIAAATCHYAETNLKTPKVKRKTRSDVSSDDESLSRNSKKKSSRAVSSDSESESKKKAHKKKKKYSSDSEEKAKSKKKGKKLDLSDSEAETSHKKKKHKKKKQDSSDDEDEQVVKTSKKKKKQKSLSSSAESDASPKKSKKKTKKYESDSEEEKKSKKKSKKPVNSDDEGKSKKKTKKQDDDSVDSEEKKENKSKKKTKKRSDSDCEEEQAEKPKASHVNDLIDLDFAASAEANNGTEQGNEKEQVKPKQNEPTLVIDPETGLPTFSVS